MWNIWKVAMGLCPRCWKESCILMQKREWKDVFDWKMSVPCDTLCHECEAIIEEEKAKLEEALKEWVGFFCDCGSIQVIRAESDIEKENNREAWMKYRLHSCNHCWDWPFKTEE